MTPTFQPRGSKLCGHACVASVADVPLQRVVELIGHKRGTTTLELLDGLAKLGIKATPHVRPGESYGGLCIVQLRRPKRRNFHWIVIDNGIIHDPSPDPLFLTNGARFGAYIQIDRKAVA